MNLRKTKKLSWMQKAIQKRLEKGQKKSIPNVMVDFKEEKAVVHSKSQLVNSSRDILFSISKCLTIEDRARLKRAHRLLNNNLNLLPLSVRNEYLRNIRFPLSRMTLTAANESKGNQEFKEILEKEYKTLDSKLCSTIGSVKIGKNFHVTDYDTVMFLLFLGFAILAATTEPLILNNIPKGSIEFDSIFLRMLFILFLAPFVCAEVGIKGGVVLFGGLGAAIELKHKILSHMVPEYKKHNELKNHQQLIFNTLKKTTLSSAHKPLEKPLDGKDEKHSHVRRHKRK